MTVHINQYYYSISARICFRFSFNEFIIPYLLIGVNNGPVIKQRCLSAKTINQKRTHILLVKLSFYELESISTGKVKWLMAFSMKLNIKLEL